MMSSRDQWCSIEHGPNALACIVCDKALVNWDNSPNQPCDGLAFHTSGHWPSSLFDSMGDGHLEISICDECLVRKASKQVAYVPRKEPRRCLDPDSAEAALLLKMLEAPYQFYAEDDFDDK
jgi:hypothetical protein